MWWDSSWGPKCVSSSTINSLHCADPTYSDHSRTANTALLSGPPINLQTCRLGRFASNPLLIFSTLLRAEQLPGWRGFNPPQRWSKQDAPFRPPHNYGVKDYWVWVENMSPPVREGGRVNASHSKTDVLLVSWQRNVRITAKEEISTVTVWYVASGDVKHRNNVYSNSLLYSPGKTACEGLILMSLQHLRFSVNGWGTAVCIQL